MTEKLLHIESPFIFQDKVNGPAQFVRVNPKGLAFIILAAQAINHFFGLLRFAQADHGSGSNRPLEMGVADLFVGPSGALAVGLFFGSDQPGIGAKALHRAKALDVVHFVQDGQGQDLAHTGNGPEQIKAVVVMLTGGFFDLPLKGLDEPVKCLGHGQIGLNRRPQ